MENDDKSDHIFEEKSETETISSERDEMEKEKTTILEEDSINIVRLLDNECMIQILGTSKTYMFKRFTLNSLITNTKNINDSKN